MKLQSDMVVYALIPKIEKLRQEDCRFVASLEYIVRLCFKMK